MKKIGLKLWSANTDRYYAEAARLYQEGAFDFIELYALPNTLDLLPLWQRLSAPFTIHAPHFNHGVNLADAERRGFNQSAFEDVFRWADGLSAEYIIFHPGVQGRVDESIRQILQLKDPRMIVENKPPFQMPSMRVCRGACVEEVATILAETGVGLCLDVGHAMCCAASLHCDPYAYLARFQALDPVYYHLMDNIEGCAADQHLHLGRGSYDLERICRHILNPERPILLETDKGSLLHLQDFEEDVRYLTHIFTDNE